MLAKMTEPSTSSARLSQVAAHLSAIPPSTSLSSPTQTHQTPQPSAIILCGWIGAPPESLKHWVSKYAILYPSARILVLGTAFQDLFPWPLRSDEARGRGIDEILDTLFPSADGDERVLEEHTARYAQQAENSNGLLVHILSDGGAYRFALLATRYFCTRHTPLPMQALVLDGAPAPTGPGDKAAAVTQLIAPAWPARPVVMIISMLSLTIMWVWTGITWQHEPVAWACEALNDPKIMRRQAARSYIYSQEDLVVDYKGVEAHAESARKRGFDVSLNKFKSSHHVQHARTNPDEYWRVITNLWDTVWRTEESYKKGNGKSKAKVE